MLDTEISIEQDQLIAISRTNLAHDPYRKSMRTIAVSKLRIVTQPRVIPSTKTNDMREQYSSPFANPRTITWAEVHRACSDEVDEAGSAVELGEEHGGVGLRVRRAYPM